MANYFIGGVMTAELFAGDQLFSTAKTLLDSSITISVDSAEVRGGQGNKLFGKYFHTSKFDMKFTNAMWKLEYVAKNIGSAITIGGDGITNETVVLTTGGVGETVATPVAFDTYGTIGWVTLPNTENWQKVTFTGKTFTSPVGVAGDSVCVKFVSNYSAARKLVVSSNIIPSEIKVIGRVGLFKAGVDVSESSRVGYVQFEIPRFLLNGSQEISMTSNGVSNTPLSGSALEVASTTCDGDGHYAIITEILTNSKWYDSVFALAFDDDTIAVSTAASTSQLNLYAVPMGAVAFKPPYADITWTSSDATKATVSASGLVTKVAIGTATISATITEKTGISAQATVTVS